MVKSINKLEGLLNSGVEYLSKSSESELAQKPSPEKWSKKEILGHLVDSGINNLQRFTEIQFENKPYKIRKYNQDELVKANDYQNAELEEVVNFWLAINRRILYLMKQQTDDTLCYEIVLDSGDISDLKFLIEDYVDHLEHHLKQLVDS